MSNVITIETWLDSGANHQSDYRTSFEIDADEWAAMNEKEDE
jgi:hypothetical protein